MRGVRQENAIPNKKRLIIRHRFINKIIKRLHGGTSDLQAHVPVPATTPYITVRHRIGKAMIQRIALPPLAGLQG